MGDFVRYGGEDPSHSRVLAASDRPWPPIYVHRASMTVVDGFHRACAARRRGDSEIAARLLDCSLSDAFVLAVRANVGFGKPLTLAERERSARRILSSHPQWSDRAIAEACGIAAATVRSLRQRSAEGTARLNTRRIGRDGKSRPVNPHEARQRAAELLRLSPTASLREIGRQVGLSPATVKDVRERLDRGEPPHAEHVRADPSPDVTEAQPPATGPPFSSWFAARVVRADDWRPFVDQIPASRIYEIADAARSCAAEWRRFADAVESRTA